eukprot:TRINITY_DN11179_c0_g1_i3.p1 TRINITY_DN11179_c0_g1~~TRINITY_DN11179_c0_g1_i3.p1  ORF type:complete len:326 (-),score=50.59 TRINITY_DN11179_c0_g1_i3:100-1017(-)
MCIRDSCDFVYIIHDGNIEISSVQQALNSPKTLAISPRSLWGINKKKLSLLGPMSIFGDHELIYPSQVRRTAATVVSTSATVYRLPFQIYSKIYHDGINFTSSLDVRAEWRLQQAESFLQADQHILKLRENKENDEKVVPKLDFSRIFTGEDSKAIISSRRNDDFTWKDKSLFDILTPVSPRVAPRPLERQSVKKEPNNQIRDEIKKQKVRLKRGFILKMEEMIPYFETDGEIKIKDVLPNMRKILSNMQLKTRRPQGRCTTPQAAEFKAPLFITEDNKSFDPQRMNGKFDGDFDLPFLPRIKRS